MVGDSSHRSHHHRYVGSFVVANCEALNDRISAFYQVSLSAASEDPESVAAEEAITRRFLDETGWHPNHLATFGGALVYTQYGPLTRFVVRRIAREEGGDTDTSRDDEYTDWNEVTAFAERLAADHPDLRQT